MKDSDSFTCYEKRKFSLPSKFNQCPGKIVVLFD